jgi:hypothetical protein
VASQYWTLGVVHTSLVGLVAGDVIDVKLWCADATWLNWNYKFFACTPTRIRLFNDARKVAFNVQYTDGGIFYPVPTLGIPGSNSIQAHSLYGTRLPVTTLSSYGNSNPVFYVQKEETTWGIMRWSFGDVNNSTFSYMSATNYPKMDNCRKITKIAWNELFLQI